METKKRTREDLLTPYQRNREKFTYEQLLPYEDQWVAFSLDGSTIVASATTIEQLETALGTAGIDPRRVCFECINLDSSFLGAL